MKAEKKGVVFLKVNKGREVKVEVKCAKEGLMGARRWWYVTRRGTRERCEFWPDGVPHSKDNVESRTANLLYTIFYRPMEEGEVGEEQEDSSDEAAEGEVDIKPKLEAPAAEAELQPAEGGPKKAASAKKPTGKVEPAPLRVVSSAEVGDQCVMVDPAKDPEVLIAEVTVTHVFDPFVSTAVSPALIGTKMMLEEGYVGVVITKMKCDMKEKDCKCFLKQFSLAGGSFDSEKDDFPSKLMPNPRIKLV